MAVAPEALEAGAQEAGVFRAASAASGQLRRAPSAAVRSVQVANRSVGSPSAAAKTITKLIWAIVMGLIALEVAAEATGQRWTFDLPSVGRGPAPKSPYLPLYSGQASSPVSAALPGILPGASPVSGGATPGALLTP